MAFESALELQEERDIERLGLSAQVSNYDARSIRCLDDVSHPKLAFGAIVSLHGWMNDLEAEEALKAISRARFNFETAPDLWKNLVESQATS